jgi:MFS superfamily sulfate permease-like transporter
MTVRLEGGPERWVPGLRTLREYQRSWLASDLVAGLVLTALLVPVGMGYAQAAGLPPITGLYATIVPLVAYAIFGPSRVMVLGPDSSLAAVIAAVILPLGGDDPETAVALAGALAVTTVLSQSLAAQRNETVDPDQELRALGANLAAGCSSPSPSPAAPPAPRWPCPPAPAPSSRPWWAPSPSPCCWCSRPACSATSRCRCWPRS